jgi:hypothetical protein
MVPAAAPGPVMATALERISVDRLLALGVTRTWQEAVAVAHAASSLAEVSAVLYGTAPLVTAGSCILTTAGDVELPETTDKESDSAVLELLQQLLTGVETPPEVEAVAFGYSTSDVTTRLSAFAGDNRRATIAKLAARAVAAGAAMAVSVQHEPAPLVMAGPPAAAAVSAPAVARARTTPPPAPEAPRLEPWVNAAKPPKIDVGMVKAVKVAANPPQPPRVDASSPKPVKIDAGAPKPALVDVSLATAPSETAAAPTPIKAHLRPLKRPSEAGGHHPDGPRGPLNEELQRLRRKILEAAGNTSLKIRLLRVRRTVGGRRAHRRGDAGRVGLDLHLGSSTGRALGGARLLPRVRPGACHGGHAPAEPVLSRCE